MGWITARSALDRDFQRQGANLVDLAADGLVRTKAKALTIGRADPCRDIELPPSFWREMQRLTSSAYRDWKAGTFNTAIADFTGVMPSNAQRAVGVSFNVDDLGSYLPAAVPPAPSPLPTKPQVDDKPRGRSRAKGWDAWIAQLALAVNEGEVTPGTRAEHLINRINERLTLAGQDEMARATVQSAVDAVLEAIRTDTNG